ncbi:MAG: nitrilase-related carbon-nitrogen hydrolase, partial [Pseudomonadota bacterium]
MQAGGVAGGFYDWSAGSATRTYNACVAIAPSGEIAAIYRKIHLFDVDIPGGARRQGQQARALAHGHGVAKVGQDAVPHVEVRRARRARAVSAQIAR